MILSLLLDCLDTSLLIIQYILLLAHFITIFEPTTIVGELAKELGWGML
jgi:hypothetical protein